MLIQRFITDFADQAVVLPLAATVAVTTAATGWRRGALAWTLVVCAALFLMLILKLLFAACGLLLVGRMLHSPSGHTASAAIIYGGLATLLISRFRTGAIPAVIVATLFAIFIGLSRLSLGVHTLLEVLVGGSVGIVAAIILSRLAGRPPPGWRLLPVCLAGLVVIAVFHGMHLPAEAKIDDLANVLWPFSVCVDRADVG